MSQPDDVARRDAFEDDVRTALFRPNGELRRLQFRLSGFALGVGLLVVLAPTWFQVDGGTEPGLKLFSGVGLFGNFLAMGGSPLGAFGIILMVVYLLLALILLVVPPGTTTVVVLGIAGLLATFLVVVNQPTPGDELPKSAEAHWTGAPLVALLLWLLLTVNAVVAHKALSD